MTKTDGDGLTLHTSTVQAISLSLDHIHQKSSTPHVLVDGSGRKTMHPGLPKQPQQHPQPNRGKIYTLGTKLGRSLILFRGNNARDASATGEIQTN